MDIFIIIDDERWNSVVGQTTERTMEKGSKRKILADPIEILQLQNISDGLNNGCPSVVLAEIQHRLCSKRCHCNHANLLAASISINSDQMTAAMLVQQFVGANIGFSPHRAECSRSASRLYTLGAAL